MTDLEALRLRSGDRVVVTCYKPNPALLGTVLTVTRSPYTGERQVVVAVDNPPENWRRIQYISPQWVEREGGTDDDHSERNR